MGSRLNSLTPAGTNKIPDVTTMPPKRARRSNESAIKLTADIIPSRINMIISLSGLSTAAIVDTAASDATKLTHSTISCCLSGCFWTYVDLTDQIILPSAAIPSAIPVTSPSLFDRYIVKLAVAAIISTRAVVSSYVRISFDFSTKATVK